MLKILLLIANWEWDAHWNLSSKYLPRGDRVTSAATFNCWSYENTVFDNHRVGEAQKKCKLIGSDHRAAWTGFFLVGFN